MATILSAQCTDARVNQVTKYLFLKYKNARELAAADFEELCEDIHSCGCYRVKAKNLIGMAKILEEKYGGEVPADMDKLTELPGVGRKTANVVLSNAFGIPGFAVDTHVFRVSNRLGLAQAEDVRKTEEQMCALIPEEKLGAGTPLAYLSWQADMPCAQARLFRLFFKRSLPGCSSALLQIERGGEKNRGGASIRWEKEKCKASKVGGKKDSCAQNAF